MHMSCICHAGKEWCNQFFNEPSPAFTSHNRFSWMAKDENWGLLCHSCCLDLSPFSLDAGLDDQNIYCITYVHIMRILQIDYIILHVQYIIQQIDSIDIIMYIYNQAFFHDQVQIIHLTVGFPNLKDQSMRIKHWVFFWDDPSKLCFMVVLFILLCRIRHTNKIRQFLPRVGGRISETNCGFQTLISDSGLNLEKMSPHSWSCISIIPRGPSPHKMFGKKRHCSILFVHLINCMLRSPCFDRNHKGLLLLGCFWPFFHNE